MSTLAKAFEITRELRTNLDTVKRIYGDRWSDVSKEYRIIILAAMEGSGDTNPITCALPIAKEMSKRNQNPLILLAVATEMCESKP